MKSIDRLDNVGIDFVREDLLDNVDRRFIRHAHALNEVGFEPGFFHSASDGFAAAMNEHGFDAGRSEKNSVARDPFADGWVGRVHETAAVFDDKCCAAKPLQIRKRFKQDVGF